MMEKSISKTDFVVVVYAICFAIGAFSHARDFVVYGWRPYIAAPLPFELFWSSLILIDVVVVAFLLSKHRHIGIFLALLVMLADVSINTYASIVLDGVSVWKIVLQAVFLGLILGSIGFIGQPSNGHIRS